MKSTTRGLVLVVLFILIAVSPPSETRVKAAPLLDSTPKVVLLEEADPTPSEPSYWEGQRCDTRCHQGECEWQCIPAETNLLRPLARRPGSGEVDVWHCELAPSLNHLSRYHNACYEGVVRRKQIN